MQKTYKIGALVTLLSVSLLGGMSVHAESGDLIVSQKNRTYAPKAVTLKKGESLKIINDDIFLHHTYIKSDKLEYDSGSQKEGVVIEIPFKLAGNYEVLCAIHPKMKLDVTVE